jgi:hypothetical protein
VAKSLLAETKDFFRLYLHHAGESEVPPSYHMWSAIALVAASLTDRVWIRKFADSPVRPNLYTMLIGPSALGKDVAINTALKFCKDLEQINLYCGEATASYLVHALAAHAEAADASVIDKAKLFLVTPELAMSVGEGELARSFIRHMTALYSGAPVPFSKGTMKHSLVTIKDPLMNWLAGTTVDWLIDAIPPSVIKGGFLGRFVCVPEDYDFTVRFPEPLYPTDRPFVVDYLRARIENLLKVEGEFCLATDVIEMRDHWYRTRPVPHDPMLIPTWRREDDMAFKLAMVLAKARDEHTLRIERNDWIRAQQLAAKAAEGAVHVMGYAQQSVATTKTHAVREVIKRAGTIGHSALMRRTGLSAPEVRECILDLEGRTEIVTQFTENAKGPKGRIYVWSEDQLPAQIEDGEATAD